MFERSRPAPLTLVQARRLVAWVDRAWVAPVHDKGHVWFQRRLLPALAMVASVAQSAADKRALGSAYYIVGDIHDFNHAPREALAAYRTSLRWWPDHGAAWREIGNMQQQVGQLDAARASLRKSLRLDPTEPDALR